MKANINSTHAKLYKFTYKSNLPQNLCPYFWKLIAGIILFIPNFIMQLPVLIYVSICSLFSKQKKSDESYYDCGDYRTFGVVTYFSSVIVIYYISSTWQWLKWAFGAYSYKQNSAITGGILNLFLIIVGLYFLIRYLIEEYRHRKSRYKNEEHIEPNPNIIKEFVKAKYYKYCPKIEWNTKAQSEAK